jgi:two-component system, NtrC family, sensor histidine kinase PilS
MAKPELSRYGALMEASSSAAPMLDLSDRENSQARLWRAFMAARILVAGILLILLLYLRASGMPPDSWALVICLSYLVLTVWVRVLGRPSLPGARFDPQWLMTIGVDVMVFGLLLYLQVATINFTPLFVLPVLLAAVLGPLLLALGTAAAVTVALLLDALQYTLVGSSDAAARYGQAALTGTGLFVIAYLSNQLSTRLVRQERVALGSEMVARAQIQVNQLVIDNLSDGVLVIDANGVVHAANPAARQMLASSTAGQPSPLQPPFVLAARAGRQTLADMAAESFRGRTALAREVIVLEEDGSQRQLHVKTSLPGGPAGSSATAADLCVMFIEDLREMQARVRTEKLAAMGRMSAAVAHEIRNPLSAIAQANALLAEELNTPQQQKLARMVAQNVKRLSRVVDDVLDVSRAQGSAQSSATLHDASRFVQRVCHDWTAQHSAQNIILPGINTDLFAIKFEEDHLRRVLVNLLDNALRHASQQPGSIQVDMQPALHEGSWLLRVWSDGAPIEQGVQSHLFEPFFSSQSRSSGLGLYICRELCQRHGAQIGYQRSRRSMPRKTASTASSGLGKASATCEGNEFYVMLLQSLEATQPTDFRDSRDSRFSSFGSTF